VLGRVSYRIKKKQVVQVYNQDMPRRNVRCPYGGHFFRVEIEDGYNSARAIPQGGHIKGLTGHNQTCPICNRQLFIEYIQ
jgi:hypothetical protein